MIVAELLDELAHDIPDLHDALCRGHAEVFDVADRRDRQAIAQAKAFCIACPALPDCRRWLAGLPRYQRPCGVVAAKFLGPPALRPGFNEAVQEAYRLHRGTELLIGLYATYSAFVPVLYSELGLQVLERSVIDWAKMEEGGL